jgi:hypothetical protein
MSLTLHSVTPSAHSLIGRRIAVVDGHPIIQMAIERALAKAGVLTVPVHDDMLEGAVLGIGLDYEVAVAPLALALFGRGVPFLFYTGQGEVDIEPVRRSWPGCKILPTPNSAAEVAQAAVWLF